MNKINFNDMLNKKIAELQKNKVVPTLLLHSCCAPCSSFVLKKLSPFFNITVFYYNPNISPKEEYEKRKNEEINFIKKLNETKEFNNTFQIKFLDCDYDNSEFFNKVKGLENEPEGGKRCKVCYKLRLEEVAKKAKLNNFEFFSTTLSVSPYKNSQLLNEIGKDLSEKYNIEYLFSDFKKENGYKTSIELSKENNLYRQDYCGCVFSLKERNEKKLSLKHNNN